MNGNITTSRMGIIGNRCVSDFSFEVSILVADVGCQMLDVGLAAGAAIRFKPPRIRPHPTSA
jgi:hypothetical protein